jgi:(2R)-3-sulfolactate dehydrogenase (NADP+)
MSVERKPAGELESLATRALMACRTSEENARSVARALTQAEVDGQTGHGLARVPIYGAQARVGKVDGFASPAARQTRPAALMVDAANGFAYPAFDLARPRLVELARAAGIAAAAICRSHHYGVAGFQVEQLADQGLIGLVMGNTPEAMAAWGGRRPLFGTNPLAFAAPLAGRPPVVIDMALSEVARSKVRAAADRGTPIPPNWAVDTEGRPTTDAKAALKGSLMPVGGAKGSALALMVETLAVALVGARFGFEATSFLDDQGGPPGVGQVIIAIDPEAFAGRQIFLERMGDLIARLESDQGARLPGARRLERRAEAAGAGVPVAAALIREVEAIAAG